MTQWRQKYVKAFHIQEPLWHIFKIVSWQSKKKKMIRNLTAMQEHVHTSLYTIHEWATTLNNMTECGIVHHLVMEKSIATIARLPFTFYCWGVKRSKFVKTRTFIKISRQKKGGKRPGFIARRLNYVQTLMRTLEAGLVRECRDVSYKVGKKWSQNRQKTFQVLNSSSWNCAYHMTLCSYSESFDD